MQTKKPLQQFYSQQHEFTKTPLTNFSQMPNAAESLQMTMIPYLMDESTKFSSRTLMARNRS